MESPLPPAASLANIAIMEREDLCGRARELETELTSALAPLAPHDVAGHAALQRGTSIPLAAGETLFTPSLELGILAGVTRPPCERLPGGEVVANPRRLLVQRRSAAGIVPEVRGRGLTVELDETRALSFQVKDAPGARRCGRRRWWRGLRSRSCVEYSTMNSCNPPAKQFPSQSTIYSRICRAPSISMRCRWCHGGGRR